MVRETPAQPPPYPAETARGGEIILRKRWQRLVFLGARPEMPLSLRRLSYE